VGMVEAAGLAFLQPAALVPRRSSATAAHKHREITSAAPALRMTQTPPPAKPGFVVRLRPAALAPFISVCMCVHARACAYALACQSGAMLNKPNARQSPNAKLRALEVNQRNWDIDIAGFDISEFTPSSRDSILPVLGTKASPNTATPQGPKNSMVAFRASDTDLLVAMASISQKPSL